MTGIRLLIVDDDDGLRQNLVRRYMHLGMTVTDAESAESLLAMPKAGPWDVALLDLHLPGIDGIATLDGVSEVAAIGVDDDDYGKRLRAFVVCSDGASISEDDVKGHVKSNLARYKVPRDVIFLEELPRNATGKVLKRELADRDDS